MYNVRIPYRKFTLAKNGEFKTVVELSTRTKDELKKAYKSDGVMVDFIRGFIQQTANRNEIADTVFSRAHEDVLRMER